ncbi:MAG TPA: hypothetical protein VNV44_05725 [Solirubrobacteraceae bacterium]|jgi:hypothetical protein|nr:hypothetical protein [Solirubrobacteraceae bacterium]
MTYSSQAYAASLVADRRREVSSRGAGAGPTARTRHLRLVAALMRRHDRAQRAGRGAASTRAGLARASAAANR